MLSISGDESPKERVKWLDGNQVGHFLFHHNPLWCMFGGLQWCGLWNVYFVSGVSGNDILEFGSGNGNG